MDNQNQETVNSVEEQKVVEATQEETQPIAEESLAEVLLIEKKEDSENEKLVVVPETKPTTQDCSAEILSVNTDEEELVNEEHESIEDLTSHYSKMTREELLKEMKELSNSESIEKMKMHSNLVRNAFKELTNASRKELKEKFIQEGGAEEEFKWENDALDIEFNKYYGLYREKRQNYIDEQEKIKQENVAKKNAILEELRLLLNSEDSLKEIYDNFNLIQEKWKAVGQVPRTEVNGLWQNYHFLIEQFYDKVKMNRELRELDLKRNLDAKIELCERVEGLILETSINKSFKALQEIHQQWKEIGSVPVDKNEEIWERFKTASDQINKRRQDYYESMKEELDRNLLTKVALCEKAEEIFKKEHRTAKEWNDSTNEMNDMLKLWKSVGQVPQKDNEAIWTRFKSCLDNFFSAKKEVFDKMKEEQDINYNKKVEICVKAEAISERNDWKHATQELLELQKQWKEIGYVSKKLSDKLWARFRMACDKFFENKSAFYIANRENETENMAKKEALIKSVQDFVFGENKEENLTAIKEFQRQWSEIGYVPASEKERLQKEFRSAINFHFEKLQINARDFQLNSFKERFSNNGGDDRSSISKERRYLQDKIQKLKDDLNLWENNLGFLASSKQADVLKAEFEKKMDNARKEIALDQAKLKMIDSALVSEEK
jgi:hypothetical protein